MIALSSKRAWTQIAGSYAAAVNTLCPLSLAMGACVLWREVSFASLRNPLALFSPSVIQLNTRADIVAAGVCVTSVIFMLGYSIVTTARKGLKRGQC